MKKKSQGISINTIIIAAIALIVLVVLVAIFTGRIGLFGREVGKVGKDCADHYSVDESGAELASAVWKAECGDGEKDILTTVDSGEHPEESCCVQWEDGAALRAR